ncbi:MAG: hypothetical protein HKN09_06715 [Saprospiraceae bacterium]|nr:hypothetical protein [Saprospiraceae bacterium]
MNWIFFQRPILGFAASGPTKTMLIELSIISENDWLREGGFGPEGNILIIPKIALAMITMKFYSNN